MCVSGKAASDASRPGRVSEASSCFVTASALCFDSNFHLCSLCGSCWSCTAIAREIQMLENLYTFAKSQYIGFSPCL